MTTCDVSEENSIVQTWIHLNVARRPKLAGFQKWPPKHKKQTEEFSLQDVIFMLLWTTAADQQSCLSQQSVQGSNIGTRCKSN